MLEYELRVFSLFFINYLSLNLSLNDFKILKIYFQIQVALRAMKTKKRLEKQLNECDSILTNLEYQCDMLSNSQTSNNTSYLVLYKLI